MFLIAPFLFWSQILHPHLRCGSKIAKYIVLSRGALTQGLIFDSKQFAIVSFHLIVSRLYLKERFSSRKKPKYFVLLSIFIFCPLILKFMFLMIFLFFDLNRRNSVLYAFSNILLALSHITIFLRSKLIFLLRDFSVKSLLQIYLNRKHLNHQQSDEHLKIQQHY